MNKTLDEQIACVKRELAMRERVYARKVNDGKMSQEQATHEIDCMKAILETLHDANRQKGGALL